MVAARRTLFLAPLLYALPATAQLAGKLDLSASCQGSAASLITTPFATCTSIIALASVFAATGSIVQPLDNWLTTACARDCPQSVLDNAASILEQGCAGDIANGSAIAAGLSTIVGNYTQVKELICLQSVSNTSFCLTSLLSSVEQSSSSSLNVSVVSSLLTGGATALLPLVASVPKSTLCSDCTNAMFTKLDPFLDDSLNSVAETALDGMCGAGFLTGSLPQSVIVATAAVSGQSGSSTPSPTATGSVQAASPTPTPTSGATMKRGVEVGAVLLGAMVGGWVLA